ncbi:MAG: hypothetical protein METHP_02126 [Methanoregula sp. SKADARSKE-2]|nr:MAG: hypothetical protein METHP_02126 [Methanoregula sp. SKADARSKE-2]
MENHIQGGANGRVIAPGWNRNEIKRSRGSSEFIPFPPVILSWLTGLSFANDRVSPERTPRIEADHTVIDSEVTRGVNVSGCTRHG